MAVNQIVGAVASALKSRFGLSVYQDQVEQGLKRPCFYLAILSVSMEPVPRRGTALSVLLDVHYFPKTDGDHAETAGMAAFLLQALEVIPLPDGGAMRGVNRQAEETDGVLHGMVRYTILLKESEKIPEMEILQLKSNERSD